MIIEYCEVCGLRISESISADEQLVKVGDKSYHAQCVPADLKKKASGRATAVAAAPVETVPVQDDPRGSKSRMRAVRRDSRAVIVLPKITPPAGSAAATPAAYNPAPPPAPAPSSNSKLVIIGGGIAAVVGLVLIVVFGGSREDVSEKKAGPTQVATVTTPTVAPVKPVETPTTTVDSVTQPVKIEKDPAGSTEVDKEFEKRRSDFAARLLQEAKQYAKDHPNDLKKYRDKLSTLVTTYRSTPAGDEASKLIVDVKVPEPPPPPPPEKLVFDEQAWKQAVNLMPLIDVAKDAVGQWKMDNSTLICTKTAKESKLHLSYQPGEEYDLRVVFMRNEGNDIVVNYLSAAGKSFLWVLGTDANKSHGFTQVNGAGAAGNPTTVKGKLDNNRKYTSVVQVRADGVKTFLDGNLVSKWKTDYKDASLPPQWKMHNDTVIGIGCLNDKVTYYSIDVLDVKGTGKSTRDTVASAQSNQAGATVAQNPKTDPAKPAIEDSATAAASAKVEYEKLMSDVYALLTKDGLEPAISRLEKAKSDKLLASLKDDLDLDVQLARYVDDLNKGSVEGAKLLVDKRPFTFKKTDGKEVQSGKGTSISVTGVNDSIQIEESAGGGKIQAKIDFEQLAAITRLDLARMGLAQGGETFLKLAFGEFLLLQSTPTAIAIKEVRTHIELARKGQAPIDRIKHLAARLDFYELECGADGALQKIVALTKEKKWDGAKSGLEEFKKDYLGTKAIVRLQPEIEKLAGDIEYGLNPCKPGLWASFWSGDGKDRFKVKHLARAETKISQDWGAGSPDKTVPNDNFGVIWAGVLRIDVDKKYKFTLKADDSVTLKIDAKVIKTGEEMMLAKGDHEIQIVYFEATGNASVNVKWKPDGGADQDLTPAMMFHDPRQIEKYEKK